MLWLNTHASSRKRLSPYIDGQLSPKERTTLEAHLAGCDACRRELAELRATISAVGGLADVESPRSFALLPRMLERRVAVPLAAVPPLATGMRLAGAGLAVALAVVLIGDLGSFGGNSDSSREETGALRQAAELRTADSDTNDAGGDAAAPAATGAAEQYATVGADRASADDLAAAGEKTESCPSSSGEARDAAASAAAAPVPSAASAGGFIACAPAAGEAVPESETPANVEPLSADEEREGTESATADSEEDGGVSTLTVLEIILAGGLIALVGGIGIEYVLRRRAA